MSHPEQGEGSKTCPECDEEKRCSRKERKGHEKNRGGFKPALFFLAIVKSFRSADKFLGTPPKLVTYKTIRSHHEHAGSFLLKNFATFEFFAVKCSRLRSPAGYDAAARRLHLPTPKPNAITARKNPIAGIIDRAGGSTPVTDMFCSVRIICPPVT